MSDSPAPRAEPAEARKDMSTDAPQPSKLAIDDMIFPEPYPSAAADDTTPEVVITGTDYQPSAPHVLTKHSGEAELSSSDKPEFSFPVLEKLSAEDLHAGYLNHLHSSRNYELRLVNMMKKRYEESLEAAESKLTGLKEDVALHQTTRAAAEDKLRIAVENMAKFETDFSTYKKTAESKEATLTMRAEDAEGHLATATEELTGLKRHISQKTKAIFGKRSHQLSSDSLLKLKAVYMLTERLYCGTICTIKAMLDKRSIPDSMKGVIELLSTLPQQVNELK